MVQVLSEHYQIDHFNDTFALGHYARVMDALQLQNRQPVAFKVLRNEHLSPDGDIRWEYRAFINEADLLTRLANTPQAVKLYDCGYLASTQEAPNGGEYVSFATDARQFGAAIAHYAEKGWRPYLALQNLPRAHNLLYLMKPNRPDVRWRLPTEEGLALAFQFGQLLKFAHSAGVVYLDHKLEHVYWDGAVLRVIDFNSSRLLEAFSANEHAQYLRMDVHNLCVGILYPIFTGLSPQKTSLRPMPSGLSEVESRYQDITALDFGVEPTLSPALQGLLQRGAAKQLESAEEFLEELAQVCALHGWDLPKHQTTPNDRAARDHLREGLKKLRGGQEHIREARDLFRDAAIMDGITADLEDELRRLVKVANEMLNHRVIP